MLEGRAPLRQAEHGLIPDSLAGTKVQTLQGDKSTGNVGYPHIGDRGAEVEGEHLKFVQTLTDVKETFVLHLAAALKVKFP